MKQTIKSRAAALAAKTADAYSVDRFSSWKAVAEALLRAEYSEEQAEAILRSKFTRWAADQADARYGRATAADMMRLLERTKNDPSWGSMRDALDDVLATAKGVQQCVRSRTSSTSRERRVGRALGEE